MKNPNNGINPPLHPPSHKSTACSLSPRYANLDRIRGRDINLAIPRAAAARWSEGKLHYPVVEHARIEQRADASKPGNQFLPTSCVYCMHAHTQLWARCNGARIDDGYTEAKRTRIFALTPFSSSVARAANLLPPDKEALSIFSLLAVNNSFVDISGSCSRISDDVFFPFRRRTFLSEILCYTHGSF